MAAPALNNSSDSCSDQSNRSLQPYTNIFVGIRVAFSVFAIVANLKLLVLQRKAKLWFDANRPLVLGILVANVIGSVAVMVHGGIRLVNSLFALKLSTKSVTTWMTVISDGAVFSLVLYIAALSLTSFVGLQYCYGPDKRFNLKKTSLVALAVLIMLCSLTLSLFGLNTHNTGISTERLLTTDVSFFLICMIIQFGTAFVLYKTKQLVRKLQNDFVVNRAQQHLESRVSLYRAIEATRTLIPLSAINVIIWFTLWSLDFIFDRVIALGGCGKPPEYYIWSSIMDISAASYALVYPHLLTRKTEPSLNKLTKMRKAICCSYEVTGDTSNAMAANEIFKTSVGETSGRNERAAKSKGHWHAMNAQWDTIEKSKKVALQPRPEPVILKPASLNKVGPIKEAFLEDDLIEKVG